MTRRFETSVSNTIADRDGARAPVARHGRGRSTRERSRRCPARAFVPRARSRGRGRGWRGGARRGSRPRADLGVGERRGETIDDGRGGRRLTGVM